MKTNISIEARRFPVTLRDERTGEIIQSSIILDKQRLQAAQLVGQSSKELIHRCFTTVRASGCWRSVCRSGAV